MFLEYLPEPVAQWFRFAARALDDEDFVALRAFARSGHAHLECRDQFRFFKHVSCCHRFARADIIGEGTSGREPRRGGRVSAGQTSGVGPARRPDRSDRGRRASWKSGALAPRPGEEASGFSPSGATGPQRPACVAQKTRPSKGRSSTTPAWSEKCAEGEKAAATDCTRIRQENKRFQSVKSVKTRGRFSRSPRCPRSDRSDVRRPLSEVTRPWQVLP